MEIAAENYLVTYTLLQGPRITRSSTLWRRAADGLEGPVSPGHIGRLPRSPCWSCKTSHKTFEDRTVLADVNLRVPKGATHA